MTRSKVKSILYALAAISNVAAAVSNYENWTFFAVSMTLALLFATFAVCDWNGK